MDEWTYKELMELRHRIAILEGIIIEQFPEYKEEAEKREQESEKDTNSRKVVER